VEKLKVKCIGCEKRFDIYPENFSNHEIIFCPVCGLDHEIVKKESRTIVEAIQLA
jgi:rRNA maturation endonuclease Nob1